MLRSSTLHLTGPIRVPLKNQETLQLCSSITPLLRFRSLSTTRLVFLPRHPCFTRISPCSRQGLRYSSAVASLASMPDDNARLNRFKEVYTKISNELKEELKKENMPEEVLTWYKNNLDYNVPRGRLYRGMTVVDTVEVLKNRPLTDDEYLKAAILGWAVELLSVNFIVTDDIMDASLTRRGQPCWYRKPEVGMFAINDACMLSSSANRLLRLYFKNEQYYANLVEHFLQNAWQTEIGQLIDAAAAPKELGVDKFSYESYSLAAIWKGGYTYYLPVASAMYMCGIPDTPYISPTNPSQPLQSAYDVTKTIMLLLGEYGQAQNDFLDFAAKPEEIRKIGTDIISNKNSWCINVALQHATPEQRHILDLHYGRGPSGGESESTVKVVFEEIGIREKYTEYERQMVGLIREHIARVPELGQENTMRREVFERYLSKVYHGTY